MSDMNRTYRFLLRRAKRVVAVSEGTKEQLRSIGVPDDKIKVIYNSIGFPSQDQDVSEAVRRRIGIDAASFVIGCVGNIIRRKGIDVLVRAFVRIAGNLPDLKLQLVLVGGDPGEQGGAFRRQIDSFIEKSGLSGSIRFLGYRDDAARLMPAFDIFVMPSRMESFGVAIIEAMAARVPVIASRSGSIPEVVQDGVTGVLFDNEDDQDLASKIFALIENPRLCRELKKNARSMVTERFSIADQVSQFRMVLDSLRDTAAI